MPVENTRHIRLHDFKKDCRPVSRILFPRPRRGRGLCHLSGSTGHPGNLRCLPPWPARRTGARGASNAAPETRAPGVHGISTREVYPPPDLHRDAVRSYRTFSPLPRYTRRLFSVTLAVSRLSPESHLLGGTVLCVVRTFLPIMRRQSGLQSYLPISPPFFQTNQSINYSNYLAGSLSGPKSPIFRHTSQFFLTVALLRPAKNRFVWQKMDPFLSQTRPAK